MVRFPSGAEMTWVDMRVWVSLIIYFVSCSPPSGGTEDSEPNLDSDVVDAPDVDQDPLDAHDGDSDEEEGGSGGRCSCRAPGAGDPSGTIPLVSSIIGLLWLVRRTWKS